MPVGNRRSIAFMSVFRRFCGVLPFRRGFDRVFCSVRYAASVRQIDGTPISCIYLGSVHNSRWDALQPAGRAETVSADICAAGRSKSRHKAQNAQNDGMKIARIAPGLIYLCFPASDDRTEKIRISGNNMLIFSSPPCISGCDRIRRMRIESRRTDHSRQHRQFHAVFRRRSMRVYKCSIRRRRRQSAIRRPY